MILWEERVKLITEYYFLGIQDAEHEYTVLHYCNWWLTECKDRMDWGHQGIWETWNLSPTWGHFTWSLKTGKNNEILPELLGGSSNSADKHNYIRTRYYYYTVAYTKGFCWKCAIILSFPAIWQWKESNITVVCHATTVTTFWIT